MTDVIISDNTTGRDFGGVEDVQLYQQDASTNYGSATTMQTTKYSVNNHVHSLIGFSGLSNITGPVTVSSAVLSLYWDVFHGDLIDIRRMLVDWVEGEATWNIRKSGPTNWTAGGATSDGNDRSATVSATIQGGGGSAYKYSGDLSAVVEGFINGTYGNYGLHLERNGTGEDTHYDRWSTSEGPDGQRPILTITYTAGGPSNYTISGAVSGAASVGGVMAVGRVLAGVVAGAAAIAAGLAVGRSVAGDVTGAAQPAAAFSVGRSIDGDVAGTAVVAADMELGQPNTILGDVTGSAQIAATMARNVHPALAGLVVGGAGVAAGLSVGRSIDGDVSGGAAVAAALAVARHPSILGAVAGTAAIAALLARAQHPSIAGDVTGRAIVAAILDQTVPMSPGVVAVSAAAMTDVALTARATATATLSARPI